jgi:hypothetical protein
MKKATSEAQLRAVREYKKKVKRLGLEFGPTEMELYEHICSQPAKQTYIKDLIRTDMEKNK